MKPDDKGLVGSILDGRYEVVRKIAKGGMGVVYEARHTALGRRLALKVLKSELADSEAAMERFRREAKAAAVLRHPHVVDVVDYGATDAGEPYLVMELLDGEDLATLLAREKALPVGRAVGIARQVARGLGVAHAAGIVHRDLKAENVFLLSLDGVDFAKILDFGIARSLEPEGDVSRLTGTGMVLGTPHYLSPEAARGQTDLDGRADLYALGVILYEMLTGRVPFQGGALLEVVYKHIHDTPIAPRALVATIPDALDAVVLRALEKDRDRRFQTAEQMIAALPDPKDLPGGELAGPVIGVSSGSGPPLRTTSPVPRTRTTAAMSMSRSGERRRPVVPILLAAGFLFAAGAVGAALWPDPPSSRVVSEPAPVDEHPVGPGDSSLESAPPARSPEVTFRIRSTPPGARVEIDGRERGRTPLEIEVPRGDGEVTVAIVGVDGAREERTLSRRVDADVEVALGGPRPTRPGRPATAAPRTAVVHEDRPGDLRPNPYGR